MPAASRTRLAELLPRGLMEEWRSAVRPRHAISLSADADPIEMLRSAMSSECECAGSIGDGWFTCAPGESRQVRAEGSAFTWHSHPSGPAVFSIEDCVTFRAMGGCWHLLVTPTAWSIYIAVEHPAFELPDPGTIVGPPALRMRRWLRWLERVLGADPEQLDHNRLCEAFGVHRFDSIEALAMAADRDDEITRTRTA